MKKWFLVAMLAAACGDDATEKGTANNTSNDSNNVANNANTSTNNTSTNNANNAPTNNASNNANNAVPRFFTCATRTDQGADGSFESHSTYTYENQLLATLIVESQGVPKSTSKYTHDEMGRTTMVETDTDDDGVFDKRQQYVWASDGLQSLYGSWSNDIMDIEIRYTHFDNHTTESHDVYGDGSIDRTTEIDWHDRAAFQQSRVEYLNNLMMVTTIVTYDYETPGRVFMHTDNNADDAVDSTTETAMGDNGMEWSETRNAAGDLVSRVDVEQTDTLWKFLYDTDGNGDLDLLVEFDRAEVCP